MTRRADLQSLVLVLLPLALVAAMPLGAATAENRWWPQVREIDELLDRGKWNGADKAARKLIRKIVRTSWYDPELRQILAELALGRAVAEAHLGRTDDAVWHWHTALNLDAKHARSRGLGRYGKVADTLMREHPLRAEGQIPAGWNVLRSPFPRGLLLPDLGGVVSWCKGLGDMPARDRGIFEAEILIDDKGVFHHPVVTTARFLNPILLYLTLEDLHLRGCEPARHDDRPVAVLHRIMFNFKKQRW